MGRLTGYVFDTYDDLGGRVFRSIISDTSTIPSFIKTANRLTDSQITELPDDQFALVMLDEGKKLKKYATVDKGNTALSVLYLLKQSHLLPREAVKVAASNLLDACNRFGLTPPMQLKLAAKAGVSGVSGKMSTQTYVPGAKVIKMNFPIPETPKQTTENPQLGKSDDRDVVDRTNYVGTPGSNFMQLPTFSQKEKSRTSPTDIEQEKRAEKYVDVSGWDPETNYVEDYVAPSETLLNGRYPVDSYEQVKAASDYFAEYWKEFHPRDRHEYCIKLAARMQELDIPVPDNIERYGSETYAADVDSYLEYRKPLVDPEFAPSIDTLIEKRAMISPTTFAEAVEEFDTISGLKHYWGDKVPDPWFSTFGPSLEKVANEEWKYDSNGARISLRDLEHLARNGKHLLKKSFGVDFVEAFGKNPKQIFESLPDPKKLMVARMASDQFSGTFVG